MNEITDKPEWDRKVFDETIIAKWKEEALAKNDFTEQMFNYVSRDHPVPDCWIFILFAQCIAEVRDKAPHFTKTGRVYVLDSKAAVVKSDSAISQALADELKDAVKTLEDVPDRLKDWHPGSDQKVLDLVHPSLYPLIYGKSRVVTDRRIGLKDCIDRCGTGVIIPKPDPETAIFLADEADLYNGLYESVVLASKYFSSDYQWLPCEVGFKGNNEVAIMSYINNLHPTSHTGLYSTLEKIIAETIPLWNDALSSIDIDGSHYQRILQRRTDYDFPLGKDRPLEPGESEDDDDYWEKNKTWVRNTRVLIIPEPREFVASTPEDLLRIDLRKEFAEEGIQVIVKLANIELHPEGKTEYEGGTWHVEGQLNEHICASAIYYYDQSNVTESRIAFREPTSYEDLMELAYGQDDYGGVEEIYGVRQNGPRVQTLGSVLTRAGRLIAFPNVLQHQVQPFRLADSTKPGYRKILALFLVDPYIRILSTANVPPQQRDWWAEGVRKQEKGTRLEELPLELKDAVVDEIDDSDWPISLEEAKKVREDLMGQRSAFVEKVNKDYEQQGFSFCEH
jgi:hypothetical protein